MSRLTLRLPETLHKQLSKLADDEGVSLNQYIVYSLTRQAVSPYSIQVISPVEVEKQQIRFKQLVEALGKASRIEAAEILAEREPVEAESGLSEEMVSQFQALISK